MAEWAFVADMASAAPTVLLNLNSSPWFVGPGFNLDPPTFRKGRTSNPMQPGERVTNATPNNRTLMLPLHMLPGSTPGTSIEALGRQLARDNILKVKLHTADPVFFRTFGNPGIEEEIRTLLRSATTFTLEIEAEPYAYGVREEVAGSPFTVSNDPELATGCKFDITGVKGDAATPLLLLATGTGAGGLVSKMVHFATRRRGTPSGYSNLIQAEDMLASTDTATAVDAAMSGGDRMRTTFATNAAMTVRLSDQFPGNDTATVEARGQYRVYARLGKTTASDVVKAQFRYGTGVVNHVSNAEVTLPAATGMRMIDLGFLPVPAFSDGVTLGYSGVRTKVKNSWVGLYLQRVSGTGSVDIDYLYFMPADEPTTLIAKFPVTDSTYAIDGTTESGGAVYALNTALDEQLNIAASPQLTGGGGFPALIPGVTNRIHVLRDIDPASVHPLTDTTVFRAYYWPRWLNPVRT